MIALPLFTLAWAAVASPSEPGVERIAVIAGADVGSPDEEPLRYAVSDARRFQAVLQELGGVRPERALLVLGGAPEDLLAALTEARGRAAELSGAGHRVELFFYFSGHGDEEGLHFPQGSLSLEQLRTALQAVPAEFKLSVVDACRGGRTKGVHPGPAFELAASPELPRGMVELRASSAGEAAQESEDLGSAVFTHFLISGLRGAADADQDGRVTLAELYAYAHRRTLLATGVAAAVQHPALSIDLRGAGEVVLSTLARASAKVIVPADGGRYLVFRMPMASVMGELSGEASALSLPAGQYLIERRQGAARGVAQVDLSWGGARALADNDFHPVTSEQWVARGGQVELRPWRIEADTGVEISPGAAEGVAGRVEGALTRSWGALQPELEVEFVDGTVSTTGFSGEERSLGLAAALGRRWLFSRFSVTGALGVEGRYSWEHLNRPDAARAVAAGLDPSQDLRFGSLGPRASFQASLPLGNHFAATAGAGLSVLFRREADSSGTSTAAHFVGILNLGVGYAF
jgi:hypothetical protein